MRSTPGPTEYVFTASPASESPHSWRWGVGTPAGALMHGFVYAGSPPQEQSRHIADLLQSNWYTPLWTRSGGSRGTGAWKRDFLNEIFSTIWNRNFLNIAPGTSAWCFQNRGNSATDGSAPSWLNNSPRWPRISRCRQRRLPRKRGNFDSRRGIGSAALQACGAPGTH